MKKLCVILSFLLIFFLCSCNQNKFSNSKKVEDGKTVYVSPSGNKYHLRVGMMINKKYAFQSNHYFNSNEEEIDSLLKQLPTKDFIPSTKEELDEALLNEDVKEVYVFGLLYGNEVNDYPEQISYFISKTKIYVSYSNNGDSTFYIHEIKDDSFYDDFYDLEYSLIYGKNY